MTIVIEYIKPFSTREEEKTYVRILKSENQGIHQYEIRSIPFIKNFKELELRELTFSRTFEDIKDFWRTFKENKDWITHRPLSIKSDELVDLIEEEIKTLEKENKIPITDLFVVSSWKKYIRMKGQPKQFCARCNQQVLFNSRYPKYICSDCANLDVRDKDGLKLSFTNVSMSGGLRICYWINGELVKEDTSQLYKICYIDGEEYVATEAKFGGIVIQKMPVKELL